MGRRPSSGDLCAAAASCRGVDDSAHLDDSAEMDRAMEPASWNGCCGHVGVSERPLRETGLPAGHPHLRLQLGRKTGRRGDRKSFRPSTDKICETLAFQRCDDDSAPDLTPARNAPQHHPEAPRRRKTAIRFRPRRQRTRRSHTSAPFRTSCLPNFRSNMRWKRPKRHLGRQPSPPATRGAIDDTDLDDLARKLSCRPARRGEAAVPTTRRCLKPATASRSSTWRRVVRWRRYGEGHA